MDQEPSPPITAAEIRLRTRYSRVMKCCKEFLLPGGKQIPFCAYNTIGYREQARAQLEGMEPERIRARKEHRPFIPQSITFEVAQRPLTGGNPTARQS